MKYILFCLFFMNVLVSCNENSRRVAETAGISTSDSTAIARPRQALNSLNADDLMKHIKVLASDAYEGRSPGTPGEDSTVNYLTRQFKQMGLKPGNPDGTFIQQVPMMGFTAQPDASFMAGGKKINLIFPLDYVALSHRFVPQVQVNNSDVIFVGYGIVAPEYGWDDYKGLDVKGKTIVMLINDPPIPDPQDTTKLDQKMFKGRAMTYYGRWTYK